jgi:ribosomal subunit interface protein
MSTQGVAPTAEVVVHGRHTDLTDRFRDHASQAAQKLDRFGIPLQRIDIEITHEHNPRIADRAFKVEFTCRGNGTIVRAEASAGHDLTALDRAVDRIEQQLRKAADRRHSRLRRAGKEVPVPPLQEPQPPASPNTHEAASTDLAPDVVYAEGPVVVREKNHVTRPMTVEQALEALEAVDHDFFLFHDVSTGQAAVVYRRRGYDYGLLRVTVNQESGDQESGSAESGGHHRAD